MSCKRACNEALAPSEDCPVELPCIGCDGGRTIDGDACPDCGGSGVFALTTCPHKFIGDDSAVYDVIFAAQQLERGVLPIAGGFLDQTKSGLTAIRYALGELAYWENRRFGG